MTKENTENYSSNEDKAVRCSICKRKLTNPVSVAREVGPVCYGREVHTMFLNSNYKIPFDSDNRLHNESLNGKNIIPIDKGIKKE